MVGTLCQWVEFYASGWMLALWFGQVQKFYASNGCLGGLVLRVGVCGGCVKKVEERC